MATQCQSQRQQNSIKYYNYKPSEVKTKFCPFLLSTQTLNLKELEPELGAGQWWNEVPQHQSMSLLKSKERKNKIHQLQVPRAQSLISARAEEEL